MGSLDLHQVLSDERHYGTFLCAICTNLSGLDALVTDQCHHVFCHSCLSTWFAKSNKCPTCSRPTSARSLQEAQPVAHRVLKRIQVQCPLRHVHCSWKGEYGDLQTHLLSATAHVTSSDGGVVQTVQEADDDDTDMHDVSPQDLAKSLKEEANAKFSSNNYSEARDLYSKGIDVLSRDNDHSLLTVLYSNRAAAALKLNDYQKCVEDCNAALAMDPTYVKAYVRRNQAHVELGQFETAVKDLQEGCAIMISCNQLHQHLKKTTQWNDEYQRALELLRTKQDIPSAQVLLGNLLRHCKAPNVVLAIAKAHLLSGQPEPAQRLSLQVLRRHAQNADAYMVRGQSLVVAGDFDNGIAVLREGLRLDPDNAESKRILRSCKKIHQAVTLARKSFFTRHFTEAVGAFGQALEQLSDSYGTKASLSAILHAERAEAHLRLKNYQAALQDASVAIYERDDLEQAWLIKTKAYHGLGRHLDARDELEDLLGKWGSNSDTIKKAYEKADFLVRKENRPDFYKLLGVSSIASLMEIKKQYKVKAMEYHPDKWMSATEQQREEAEVNFKMLGAGLEILSDDFQRQLYDEGDRKSVV